MGVGVGERIDGGRGLGYCSGRGTSHRTFHMGYGVRGLEERGGRNGVEGWGGGVRKRRLLCVKEGESRWRRKHG